MRHLCIVAMSVAVSLSVAFGWGHGAEQPATHCAKPAGLARLGIKVAPPTLTEKDQGGPLWDAALGYQCGNYGAAFREYKKARFYHPEDPRDPLVLLMIADCAMRGLSELRDILPSDLAPDSLYGKQALTWLKDTYGYYASASEGDPFWRYDMRALREFLRLYPDHDQADEVAYALAKEDLMFGKYDPAIFMVRDERALACAREFIRRYEDILHRYPDTALKPKIESDIALFRGYIKSGGPLPNSISNPW